MAKRKKTTSKTEEEDDEEFQENDLNPTAMDTMDFGASMSDLINKEEEIFASKYEEGFTSGLGKGVKKGAEEKGVSIGQKVARKATQMFENPEQEDPFAKSLKKLEKSAEVIAMTKMVDALGGGQKAQQQQQSQPIENMYEQNTKILAAMGVDVKQLIQTYGLQIISMLKSPDCMNLLSALPPLSNNDDDEEDERPKKRSRWRDSTPNYNPYGQPLYSPMGYNPYMMQPQQPQQQTQQPHNTDMGEMFKAMVTLMTANFQNSMQMMAQQMQLQQKLQLEQIRPLLNRPSLREELQGIKEDMNEFQNLGLLPSQPQGEGPRTKAELEHDLELRKMAMELKKMEMEREYKLKSEQEGGDVMGTLVESLVPSFNTVVEALTDKKIKRRRTTKDQNEDTFHEDVKQKVDSLMESDDDE